MSRITRRRRQAGVGQDELIKVLLIPVGGSSQEVNLKEEATAEEALEAGGMKFDSNTEVRSDGELLETDHIVENGDELVIMSGAKIEGGSR